MLNGNKFSNKKSNKEWEKLKEEKIKKYEEKRQKNLDLLKNINMLKLSMSPFHLYMNDMYDQVLIKGEIVDEKKIREEWDHEEEKLKKLYKIRATSIKNQNESYRDIYELFYRVEPTKPLCAFEIYSSVFNFFISIFSKKFYCFILTKIFIM